MSRNVMVFRNYALAVFWLFVGFALADEMTLNVNFKKPVAVVSEKFLSITLDPVVLFNSDSLSDVEKSTSMAKALSPAYVRISGPRSNSYVFERGLYPQETRLDPGYSFTENDWIHVQQWASRAGLEVIASIAPLQADLLNNARSSSWDPRNALDLISFSDHMGYNTSWQLGYECQTRCDVSGDNLARDVQRLRGMLDAFPRYASEQSLLAGPDVVTFKTRQQQQYLQEFFAMASPVLGAITWHPDFAGISLEAEGVSMHHDNLALDKDSLYRIVGRYIAKKPLWIAESRPEECKQQFLGALVWARRLGNSAKLGIQVLMRQPNNSNLFRPTPDYWVSMLHKMLVGREVLDTKITTGNRTHVHFYSHCTRPSDKYEKGSLTIFGINLTPSKITASLKGLKLKTVHKYILLPGYDAPNRMFAETILLNNELLSLIDGKQVPDVQPAVSNADKGVKLKLPSGGIGFWVLPGLKVKSCMGHEDETSDKNLLKKINKRLEEDDFEEDTELDEDSRESTDTVDSAEERKALLRQQLPHRRSLVRRSSRHERENADESNKSHKLDTVRRDFDRLEKIMKRKDQTPNRKSGSITGRIFDNIDEENARSSEESPRRSITGEKLDSGEIIRAKLQHYKKRLDDYESRKKQREMLAKELMNGQGDLINKGMDTEKVIEALTLITNVESAMKGLEKENVGKEREPRSPGISQTLGTADFADVTAGLPPSAADHQRSDSEGLLDDVLNTEKSKRTSVPTGFEDQLKALYQLLSEEKERREGVVNPASLRQKREIQEEAPTTVEPVDLRRDLRRRLKIEEVKGRRNERKQRIREKIEQKRDQKEEMKKELESNENNFYGFHQREPLKNFPDGDVYIQTSAEKKETANVNSQGSQVWSQTAAPKGRDEHEDTWLEEGEGNHMPNEFYENVKRPGINTRESPGIHGGQKNPESLSTYNNPESNGKITGHLNQGIITERQPYYKTTNLNDKGYKIEDLRQNQQQMYYPAHMIPRSEQIPIPYYDAVPYYQPPLVPHYVQELPHYQPDPMVYQQDPSFYQPHLPEYQSAIPHYQQMSPTNQAANVPNKFADGEKLHADPNQQMPPSDATYRRVKRQTNDLEHEMQQEMIDQDDNNLRDCQCRVIRGEEDCKDCIEQQKTQSESSSDITPGQIIKGIENLKTSTRFSRDVKEVEVENENKKSVKENDKDKTNSTMNYKEPETISVNNSGEQDEESEESASDETSSEKVEKEVETTTVNTDSELKLENDNDSDATPPNRLPRKTVSIPLMQFFPKSGGYAIISSSSVKQESPSQTAQTSQISNTNSAAASAQSNNNLKLESMVKYDQNTYSYSQSTTQRTNTTPSKITQIIKDAINQKQTSLAQTPQADTIATSSINTETVAEKNTGSSSTANSEVSSRISTSDTNDTGISMPSSTHQTTPASISHDSTVVRNTSNAKNQSVLKTTKKPTKHITESKSQMKNNSTHSIDDITNSRQARLTTRAEALAALRKESENRRAKKMIETSMRILDSENARFAEYQKRRHEQLERLKMKLRAKRDKMLQQYRDELLEAINENPNPQRTLRRRDLIKYRPSKYGSEELGFIGPRRQTRRRRLIPRNQASIYNDDDNNKYEKSKNRKRRTPFYEQFSDDEIYDLSGEQELHTVNLKRSPFSLIDRDQLINENDDRKLEEDDSAEYYESLHQAEGDQYHHQQQHQLGQNNPAVAQSDHRVIPLNIKYNHHPSQHQSGVDNYYDANDNEQSQQKTTDEEKSIQQNYKKPKRSNLRIVEIDPWLYDEYEPQYNFQELMRPLSQLGSRSYRHNPYEYVNRRFRREANFNKDQESGGPLSFSLGLEKSKMTPKKLENNASLDSLIRRKRVSDDLPGVKSGIFLQIRSPINKNIKKVYKPAYYYKYDKTAQTLQNKKLTKNTPLLLNILKKKEVVKFPKTPNDLSKGKFSKSLNYFKDYKHGKNLSARQKRSVEHNEIVKEYQVIKSNGIDRSLDPELDEIWNNIIEMKQDEELLKEYKEKKNEIIQNFRDTQSDLKKYYSQSTTLSPVDDKNTTQGTTSTTKTNIESMLIDAIPKLENVITGGLEKAQNLTGKLEDFVETFDDQFINNGTESSNIESGNITKANNGKLTHNVFRAMASGVKKFFDLVTGIFSTLH